MKLYQFLILNLFILEIRSKNAGFSMTNQAFKCDPNHGNLHHL